MKKTMMLALLGAFLGIVTTAGTIMLSWRKMLPVDERSSGFNGRPLIGPQAGKPWDFWTEEIDNLASELRTERAALQERARDLEATSQRIASEKLELKKQQEELVALREEITKAIPEIKVSERQNIRTLAKSYSSMKPSQAVSVLAEMDDSMVVKLLAVMKPDIVGTLFQEMAKPGTAEGMTARAARLSDQLRLMKKEDKATENAQ